MNSFREILKINWFTYKWREYNRNDWINILSTDSWYIISNWIHAELHCNSKEDLIWTLAIYNIINRLY